MAFNRKTLTGSALFILALLFVAGKLIWEQALRWRERRREAAALEVPRA